MAANTEFPTDVLPLPVAGSPDANAEVVVAGAGPVGLLLGCLLKQAGVDVVLVDPHIYSGEGSKASLTMTRSMELLEWAGVASGLREVGRPVTKARISVDGGKAWNTEVSGFQPRTERSRQQMIAVGQDRVEEALLGRFVSLGGRLFRAARVTGYQEIAQGVKVEVERAVYVSKVAPESAPKPPARLLEVPQTSLCAKFLVGCDGSSSTVREAMPDASYAGKDYQQSFILADADVPEMQVQMLGWHTHTIHMISDAASGSLLYLVRLQGRKWRTWYSDPKVSAQDLHNEFLLQKWQSLMPKPALLAPTTFTHMTLSAMSCKLAGAYRRGRVFLAGDAAHSVPAVDGQGMNLGLQDAGNLAWKLARVLRSSASDSLLDSYEAERRPVAAEVLAKADRLFSAVGPGSSAPLSTVKQAALKTVLTFVSGDQMYDREMVEKANGLSLSYFKEGTCLEVGEPAPSGALRAGSRLPDVECSEEGSHKTVHTLQLMSEEAEASGASLGVLLLARARRRQMGKVEVKCVVDGLKALVGSNLTLRVALYTCAPSTGAVLEVGDAATQGCCMPRKSRPKNPSAVHGRASLTSFEALDGVRVLAPLDPAECVQSPCAELCERFGLSDNARAILVVRPDGYVAVSHVGQVWNVSPVADALEKLGICPNGETTDLTL